MDCADDYTVLFQVSLVSSLGGSLSVCSVSSVVVIRACCDRCLFLHVYKYPEAPRSERSGRIESTNHRFSLNIIKAVVHMARAYSKLRTVHLELRSGQDKRSGGLGNAGIYFYWGNMQKKAIYICGNVVSHQ
jgi:hypothetical protein